MPYDFYSNKCFVNAGIVVEHLSQLRSQMKEEEIFCSSKQEGMDDWMVVKAEQENRNKNRSKKSASDNTDRESKN